MPTFHQGEVHPFTFVSQSPVPGVGTVAFLKPNGGKAEDANEFRFPLLKNWNKRPVPGFPVRLLPSQKNWTPEQLRKHKTFRVRIVKLNGKELELEQWDWENKDSFPRIDDSLRTRIENGVLEKKTSIIWTTAQEKAPDKQLCQEIMREIAALANAKGGNLFIGVRDDLREPPGIEEDLRYLRAERVLLRCRDGKVRPYGGRKPDDYDAYLRLILDAVKETLDPKAKAYWLVSPSLLSTSNGNTVCRIRVKPNRSDDPISLGKKIFRRHGSESSRWIEIEKDTPQYEEELQKWMCRTLPPPELDEEDRLYLTLWDNGEVSFRERQLSGATALARVVLPDEDREKRPLLVVYRDGTLRFLRTEQLLEKLFSKKGAILSDVIPLPADVFSVMLFEQGDLLFVEMVWQGDIFGFKLFDPWKLFEGCPTAFNETNRFLPPEEMSLSSTKRIEKGKNSPVFKYYSAAPGAEDFGKIVSENERGVSGMKMEALRREIDEWNEKVQSNDLESIPLSVEGSGADRILAIGRFSGKVRILSAKEGSSIGSDDVFVQIPEGVSDEARILLLGESHGLFCIRYADLLSSVEGEEYGGRPVSDFWYDLSFHHAEFRLKDIVLCDERDLLLAFVEETAYHKEDGCFNEDDDTERFPGELYDQWFAYPVSTLPMLDPNCLIPLEDGSDVASTADTSFTSPEMSFVPYGQMAREEESFSELIGFGVKRDVGTEDDAKTFLKTINKDDPRCPVPGFDHSVWVERAFRKLGSCQVFTGAIHEPNGVGPDYGDSFASLQCESIPSDEPRCGGVETPPRHD